MVTAPFIHSLSGMCYFKIRMLSNLIALLFFMLCLHVLHSDQLRWKVRTEINKYMPDVLTNSYLEQTWGYFSFWMYPYSCDSCKFFMDFTVAFFSVQNICNPYSQHSLGKFIEISDFALPTRLTPLWFETTVSCLSCWQSPVDFPRWNMSKAADHIMIYD